MCISYVSTVPMWQSLRIAQSTSERTSE